MEEHKQMDIIYDEGKEKYKGNLKLYNLQ